MRILIVEDDFTSRKLLQGILLPYGQCDVAVDGEEAIKAFEIAWKELKPYDLICLDIMMPNIDGQQALLRIREMEEEMGVDQTEAVKVIMTTALNDPKNVFASLYKGCAASYLVKPYTKSNVIDELRHLKFI